MRQKEREKERLKSREEPDPKNMFVFCFYFFRDKRTFFLQSMQENFRFSVMDVHVK